MPRTYTTSGVTLIGDGEDSGVWGTLTNTNMQILDRMLSQAGAISLSGTTHTLTISDGTLSDGQYGVLVFGGSPSGTNTVTIIPNDARRLFFVKNDSGETVTLTQGSGGDVSILDGRSAVVYCDGAGSGAEVVNLSTTLVTETAQDIGALTPTDGNFIVGNGTTWVSEAGNTVLASLGVTATADELNTLDGITASTAELNILGGVTSTTAEINLLDGVTWTLIDYNTLTSTAAELNLLDGKTLSGSDTEIVTGTAGSDGDIVQWNADGDLVSYGAATQAEADWEAGTSTTESLVSPAKVKAALRANFWDFESGNTAFTLNSDVDIPHGLGAVPSFFNVVLVCTTTDLGYSVGTELVLGSPYQEGISSRNFQITADATNISVRVGSSLAAITAAYNYGAITAASWRIKARARL